eukprot:gnl/TRDRNA2_/TRDRNA2_124679_c2_seq1.p3 gnl/TRDRNA2_/TRDRNA2_124679_c2~~gnl/TRDRNA2_/TRDRNA2_124679_c2_seq1.p3  ORF type:complete len:142 (-),score=17.76 gnl/TRDRNA2_/TRDRNA2_124679_c2_seq1:15-440(-)
MEKLRRRWRFVAFCAAYRPPVFALPPEELASTAQSLGCGPEELPPRGERTDTAAVWKCIFAKLYRESSAGYLEGDASLGKAGTYGEISPRGVESLVEQLTPWLPGAWDEDVFFRPRLWHWKSCSSHGAPLARKQTGRHRTE